MQWLCIANAAVPIISSNLIAIKASGRSDIYMRLEMIRRVVMLVILTISVFCFQTVAAIAIGFCISNCLDALISMIPAKRLLGYGVGAQIKDLWNIMAASMLMFVLVQAMNMLEWGSAILLLTQIMVGIIVYVFTAYVLNIEAQKTTVKLIAKVLHKKNTGSGV
jgi:hypothetical protein